MFAVLLAILCCLPLYYIMFCWAVVCISFEIGLDYVIMGGCVVLGGFALGFLRTTLYCIGAVFMFLGFLCCTCLVALC